MAAMAAMAAMSFSSLIHVLPHCSIIGINNTCAQGMARAGRAKRGREDGAMTLRFPCPLAHLSKMQKQANSSLI